MNSTEIWIPICGFEGYYEISSNCQVKSLKRTIIRNNSAPQTIKERILKQTVNSNGYKCVSLQDKNGKRKESSIHRLIAIHFLPNPDNMPMINHINGIKADNSLENLEWVTASKNLSHAYRIGLKKPSQLAAEKMRKYNATKVVSEYTRQKQSQSRKRYLQGLTKQS